ncbi:MAG: hypothetical protein A4E58_00867 [Syntrophorhabdus sp. PtaB.Bin006]|nr:MAG: hypothetical protein A4E58_00867 [Syntrophorhabdus sp. PtaB.Bin006]
MPHFFVRIFHWDEHLCRDIPANTLIGGDMI